MRLAYCTFLAQLILTIQLTIGLAYNLLEDFSGERFFDGWDFYGNYDNLTLGKSCPISLADPH